MAAPNPCERYCYKCGYLLENTFTFCSKCRMKILELNSCKNMTNSTKSRSFSLPSFRAFKEKKEAERSSFFVRKPKSKKSKFEEKEVVINVGIMKDTENIKRGETLPLKVFPSSTAVDILASAKKKHRDFNKRFNGGSDYSLVFKDGSEVKNVPGTEESFTLQRYKEESGLGYSRITLYLLAQRSIFEQLKDSLQTISSDSDLDEGEDLKPVDWLDRTSSARGEQCTIQGM